MSSTSSFAADLPSCAAFSPPSTSSIISLQHSSGEQKRVTYVGYHSLNDVINYERGILQSNCSNSPQLIKSRIPHKTPASPRNRSKVTKHTSSTPGVTIISKLSQVMKNRKNTGMINITSVAPLPSVLKQREIEQRVYEAEEQQRTTKLEEKGPKVVLRVSAPKANAAMKAEIIDLTD